MTFKNLNNDSNCNCISDELSVLISDIFCRRLKSKKIKLTDFNSYWEDGNHPKDKTKCNQVCKHKSISLHKFDNDDNVTKFFKRTVSLRPATKKLTPFYCTFKFKDTAGKGKPTPSESDPNHYSFFKSDLFKLKSIFDVKIKEMPE